MKITKLLCTLLVCLPLWASADIRFSGFSREYLEVTAIDTEDFTTPLATYTGTIKGINRVSDLFPSVESRFTKRKFFVLANPSVLDCRQDQQCVPTYQPWYSIPIGTWIITDTQIWNVNGKKERSLTIIYIIPTGSLP